MGQKWGILPYVAQKGDSRLPFLIASFSRQFAQLGQAACLHSAYRPRRSSQGIHPRSFSQPSECSHPATAPAVPSPTTADNAPALEKMLRCTFLPAASVPFLRHIAPRPLPASKSRSSGASDYETSLEFAL